MLSSARDSIAVFANIVRPFDKPKLQNTNNRIIACCGANVKDKNRIYL